MNEENRYQPPKAEVADLAHADESELAARWPRLGAAIIDGLFVGIIMGPVLYLSGYWSKAMAGTTTFVDQLMLAPIGIVAFLVLHGYLLHTSGQTVGKRLVGMRIVSVEDNRILPLWKVLVLRFLPVSVASQIPVVGQLAGIVDAVFIFRADQRCVHDLIAGTKVVKDSAPWKGIADSGV